MVHRLFLRAEFGMVKGIPDEVGLQVNYRNYTPYSNLQGVKWKFFRNGIVFISVEYVEFTKEWQETLSKDQMLELENLVSEFRAWLIKLGSEGLEQYCGWICDGGEIEVSVNAGDKSFMFKHRYLNIVPGLEKLNRYLWVLMESTWPENLASTYRQ